MKKKFDILLFLPVLILVVYGVVMVFSASAPTAALDKACNNDPYFFLKRHLIWLSLGFIAMFFGFKLNLDKLRKFSPIIVMISIVMLIMVLIPGLSREILGAKRSIALGPFTFQPSEFAKIAVVLYLADVLARLREKAIYLKNLVLPLIFFAIVMGLIELQPDLGTNVVLAFTILSMLFIAGTNLIHLVLIIPLFIPVLIYFVNRHKYRMGRFQAWLDPWSDPMNKGYQIIQSLLALGAGGPYGLGLGESRQKFFYLPERFTDYILAIIGEELGFFYGTLPIIVLFIIFCFKGLKIALKSRDPFKSLVAGGLTLQISLQAFINIAVVTNVLPPKGFPLPFISFGGSSLLFTLFSVGLLLNIAGEQGSKRNTQSMSLETDALSDEASENTGSKI